MAIGNRQSAILLVAESRGRLIVRRCCGRAAAAGVCPGMSVAHARAMLADGPGASLHVEPHQPAHDAAAMDALAVWATRLAPIVQVDRTHPTPEPDAPGVIAPPDGLLLDATGCERLYGGDDRMLATIAAAFARLGVRAQLAMAPTVGAAWGQARFSIADFRLPIEKALATNGVPAPNRKSEIGNRQSLSPLPVAALRLDPAVLDALAEVAIDTVGDLLAIERRQLYERFGDAVLRRIDQMTGRVAEPIVPVRPFDPPRVERRFAGPVVRIEAIDLTVRELLGELAGLLRGRGIGARRIVLDVERYEAADLRLAATLAGPTADAGHLFTLWRPRIERLHMGHGVESLAMTADRVERLGERQASRWVDEAALDRRAADAELARWLDAMTGRLGGDRVCAVEPVESHAPHDAFRRRAFRIDGDRRPAVRDARLVEADRPTLLHERPRAIGVVTLNPDGPVLSVRRDGVTRRIVRSIGPERIAGRWWRSPDPDRPTPQRDYFKLQDESGRWLWVYREVDSGRWRCHGEWA